MYGDPRKQKSYICSYYRTIDSVIAGYCKGKLTCLLVDPMSVFDMVSSKSINLLMPPNTTYNYIYVYYVHAYAYTCMHDKLMEITYTILVCISPLFLFV